MKRTYFLSILLCTALRAQSLMVWLDAPPPDAPPAGAALAFSAAPLTVSPGQTVTIAASLNGTAGDITAVQSNLAIVPAVPFTVKTPATLVGKNAVCASVASNLFSTCGVFGFAPPPTGSVLDPATVFSIAPIPDGSPVELITFTVPANAAANSTIAITATAAIGIDKTFSGVSIAGDSITLTVTTPFSTAQTAFAAWMLSPTPVNFAALVKAIAAVQQ